MAPVDPLFATRVGFIALLTLGAALMVWRGPALGAALRDFFWEKQPPVNLALLRIFTFYLIVDGSSGAVPIVELPQVLRVYPLGWEWLAPVLPLSPHAVGIVETWLLPIFGTLATIGLFSRVTVPVSALLAVYFYLIPNLHGSIGHGMHVHVLSALVVAASPSGDALSIDALIRRWRGLPAPAPSHAYTVPVRFCWLLLGTMYLFPGLWKLWEAGDLWLEGTKLRVEILGKMAEHPDNHALLRIDKWPWVMAIAGTMTLVFEIGFFFALFNRRTRVFAGIAGVAFHIGVLLLMSIEFNPIHPLIVLLDYPGLLKLAPFRWLAKTWNAHLAAPLTRLSSGLAAGLQRLAARSPLLAPRPTVTSASASSRSAAGALLVGGTLLFGMFHVGFAKVETWPLSVYPCFSRRRTEPPAEGVALSTFLQPQHGPRREIQVNYYPLVDTNAIHNLLTSALRNRRRRRDASNPKLDAVLEIVKKNVGERQPGDELLFYEWHFATDPDERRSDVPHDERFLTKLTF